MDITETPGTSGSRLNRYSTRDVSPYQTYQHYATAVALVSKVILVVPFTFHTGPKKKHYHIRLLCTMWMCMWIYSQVNWPCSSRRYLTPLARLSCDMSTTPGWTRTSSLLSGEMLWRVFLFISDKQCLNFAQSLDNWIAKFSGCIQGHVRLDASLSSYIWGPTKLLKVWKIKLCRS